MKLIGKDRVVAEIEKRIKELQDLSKEDEKLDSFQKTAINLCIEENKVVLDIIDTIEVKEVELDIITGWFDHIVQIADDRMTANGYRMEDAHALDEIKCLAKNSSEFITMHYKAQKGETSTKAKF